MKHLHTEESKLLTQEEIEFGLQLLSKYLHGYHGKPVYVFIEEFDVPVNTMVYGDEMNTQDRKQTIKLSQVMIGNLLKDNKSVERSLSNACQQLGGILSGSANNVKRCAFMQKHSLVEFYGFKEFEVKGVLEKAGLTEYLNKTKTMYNGYKTKSRDGDDIEIYSPWAIIQYVVTEEFAKYWSAGIPKGINEIISNSKISSKITEMMSGKSVRIEYREKLKIKDINTLNKMICKNETGT
ncbi:hypothetical protein PV326_014451 [Microctonus aethiopoides]|nr:hypothetical protein PV326_014451 [Microctonus aethiopoides]